MLTVHNEYDRVPEPLERSKQLPTIAELVVREVGADHCVIGPGTRSLR
jgi:hypothetical protein